MSKKDGGPAFPTDDYYDEKRIGQFKGMTLRDYFAGQALAGFSAQQALTGEMPEIMAEWAYQQADAMLAERDR